MKHFLIICFLFSILQIANAQITWQKTNFTSQYVSCLTADANGNVFAGTTQNSVFRTTDDGSTWTLSDSGGLGNYIHDLAVSPVNGHIFAATHAGWTWRSTDTGVSWTQIKSGLTTKQIWSVGVAPNGYVYAGTGALGIFQSTNDGDAWTQVQAIPSIVRCFAFDASGNIYAGTYGSGIYVSTNNGSNWYQKGSGLKGLPDSMIVALDVNTNGNVFAGTYGSNVYCSTDQGETWVPKGLDNTYVSDFAHTSDGTMYAAAQYSGSVPDFSGQGIQKTTYNGNHWSGQNTGMLTTWTMALVISSRGYMFVGCFDDSSIYRTSGQITSVGKNSGKTPLTFTLAQNYPNPFNPSTTISFTLPSRSFVSLKVFDILGREVAAIVSGEMSAGNYSKQWNAANMPSGAYFYRLQTGTFTETKKLVLLR